jgi:hypothetical protein
VVSTDWRGPVSFEEGDVLDGGTSRRAEIEIVLDTAVEVARLSGTYAEWIVPVLAVESEESFRGTVREVHVCSTADLLAVLDEPGSVLPPSHVKYAAQVLHSAGRPEPEPDPVVVMPLRVVPDATAPLPALPDEPAVEERATRPALVVAPPAATPPAHATPATPAAAVPPAVPPAAPAAAVEEASAAAPTAPVGPDGKKLTGRAARVAAALETAAAEAAKVAADQGGGEKTGKKKSRKPKDAEQHTRVRALVRLIVVVMLLGAGGLFGPKLVPAVEDAIGRLDGTPACVPATVATAEEGPATVSVPEVAKNGTKLTKAQRVKARKRAEARARRLAAHPVKAQALADATC